MKMTAPDLFRLGVVDKVIDEPAGGAHQDIEKAALLVEHAIAEALRDLDALNGDELADDRYRRFRALGAYVA